MSHSERDPEPQVWLFQAIQDRFDIQAKVRPGGGEPWWVTRNRNELQPGDTALLWQAGSEAGIYAIGKLESEAYEDTIEGDAGWWVDIRYVRLLDSPILKCDLLEDPLLCGLEVIKNAHRGNAFPVSEDEWRAIRGLMGYLPPDA